MPVPNLPVAIRQIELGLIGSSCDGCSHQSAFRQRCEPRTEQNLADHAAMDRFSVEEFRSFWRLFLEWCGLPRQGAVEPVCIGDVCETARFSS